MRAELEQAQAEFEQKQTEWVRDKQEAETKRDQLITQLREWKQSRGSHSTTISSVEYSFVRLSRLELIAPS